MSTSLLYRVLGIRDYLYQRTDFIDGRVVFTIEPRPETVRCPACGSTDLISRGGTWRHFRALPWGPKPVLVRSKILRLECRTCAVVRQIEVSFADRRRTYTRGFERYAAQLCRLMTVLDVAAHLGVGWDLVKDIHKRYLKKKFGQPRLKGVRYIAIDEIHVGHGNRFLTIVLDLDMGNILFVGEGKGGDALKPFWNKLRASHARVEAVAMDMSKAYIHAVRENLPTAKIVFDHFHVIKLCNEMLSDLRREVQREAETKEQKEVIKGILWLLLKNPENLNERRNEEQRLKAALKLNRPLWLAYYLKEDLRQLWNQGRKGAARAFLADWISDARATRIKLLRRFAKTLEDHREGILAFYDYAISTGPLEGTNNKIRTLQRKAYGYRDPAFFKLKLYGLHETRYELIG